MNQRTRSLRAHGLALVAALTAAIALPLMVPSAQAAEGLSGKVNINTASAEELTLLPGVGETRAQAVIDERKRRGGFKAVDDLLEVKGIGVSSLDKMRPHVTLQGKTTARLE